MLTTSFLVWGTQFAALTLGLPNVVKPGNTLLKIRAITCSRTFTTVSTDTCEIITNRFGITLTNLIDWNASLGTNCAGFVGGQAYCVRGTGTPDPKPSGVTSSTTTVATTTTIVGPVSTISQDGSCGGTAGLTCTGATFGACCSTSGWCGVTTGHCQAGCQSQFGTCDTNAGTISTDGKCSSNGKTCLGSTYGDCCSNSGWCGSSVDHCTNCDVGFGTCNNVPTSTSTIPSPTPSSNISTDGSCGANAKTCEGSTFGSCCSVGNWCGSTLDHCDVAAKCQPTWGTCSSTSNLSVDGKCGSNGKTCVGTSFGQCCSSSGFCGTGVNFCAQGCQKASSNGCLALNIPSLTGECGKNGGFICTGGPFNGKCCSDNGWCGSGAGFPC